MTILITLLIFLQRFWLADGSDSKRIRLQCRRPRFDPWVGEIPWRTAWQPIPVFLNEEFHGQRSLAGYSLWGCKGSDTTEQLMLSLFLYQLKNVLKGPPPPPTPAPRHTHRPGPQGPVPLPQTGSVIMIISGKKWSRFQEPFPRWGLAQVCGIVMGATVGLVHHWDLIYLWWIGPPIS